MPKLVIEARDYYLSQAVGGEYNRKKLRRALNSKKPDAGTGIWDLEKLTPWQELVGEQHGKSPSRGGNKKKRKKLVKPVKPEPEQSSGSDCGVPEEAPRKLPKRGRGDKARSRSARKPQPPPGRPVSPWPVSPDPVSPNPEPAEPSVALSAEESPQAMSEDSPAEAEEGDEVRGSGRGG